MMRIPHNELVHMASDKYECTPAEKLAFQELLAFRQSKDDEREKSQDGDS